MPSMPDYNTFEAEQKAAGVSELERSARWWDLLADAELDRATWDPWYTGDYAQHRARTYRRTAESLRIQERTGVAVCSCCHKPTGRGMCIFSRRY